MQGEMLVVSQGHFYNFPILKTFFLDFLKAVRKFIRKGDLSRPEKTRSTYIFCLNRNKLQGSKQIFSFGFPHLSYKNIDKASPARQVRQTVPTYNRKLVYPLQNKILYCCTSLFYIRKKKRRLFTIIQIIVTFFMFFSVTLNKLS